MLHNVESTEGNTQYTCEPPSIFENLNTQNKEIDYIDTYSQYQNCRNVSESKYICNGYNITDLKNYDVPSRPLNEFGLINTQIRELRNLTFQNKTIEAIKIQNNQLLITIETDAFIGVLGLRYLFLDNNHIHLNGLLDPILHIPNLFVPFRSLESLETLCLSNNDIRNDDLSLDSDSKLNSPKILPCLKEIDLSGNSLAFVDSGIFLPLRCSPLSHLSIANADLSSSYAVSNGMLVI
jgi:hypothetical protein